MAPKGSARKAKKAKEPDSAGTFTFSVNPTFDEAAARQEAMNLHNQAYQLEAIGDLTKAEQSFLRAIALKEQAFGPAHVSLGVSLNSLGELYMRLGKIDEAERYLQRAIDIRSKTGPAFDHAVSRENLAQALETRGALKEARRIRVTGKPNVACSNYKCTGQNFTIKELRGCSTCSSPLYCSKECQAQDWKTRHKKYCRKPDPDPASPVAA